MKCGEKNVGEFDKAVRILLGILFLLAFALNWAAEPANYVVLVIGVALLLTGLFQTCCLYSLLGFNTCGTKARKKK